MDYINITLENIEDEHLCCAISDKKHQTGVLKKKEWMKKQIANGHVFRKLDDRGKVFIEYDNLENAFVPIEGKNFLYIYCLWCSGKFKGQSHGKDLLTYVIDQAKRQGKKGICTLSCKKKTPFLSDAKFLKKFGFGVVDSIDAYDLMCLKLCDCEDPKFITKNDFSEKGAHIFYNNQCPYTYHCIQEIKPICDDLHLHEIATLEQAKNSPVLINNFAVIKDGKYVTHELLNANRFKKFIETLEE